MNFKTLISIVFCLGVLACKKHTEEDPCASQKAYSGDFLIRQRVADSLIEADQVVINNTVVFTPKDSGATYQWQIGQDTRTFNSREVKLFFYEKDVAPGDKITIKLTSTGKANTCFSDNTAQKTITKTFTIIARYQAPIIGKYVGFFDDSKNVKDTVEIGWRKWIEPGASSPDSNMTVIGINKGCGSKPYTGYTYNGYPVGVFPYPGGLGGIYGLGANALYFDADDSGLGCKIPRGWFFLRSKDSLSVNFTTGIPGTTTRLPPNKFTGVRIK